MIGCDLGQSDDDLSLPGVGHSHPDVQGGVVPAACLRVVVGTVRFVVVSQLDRGGVGRHGDLVLF